MSRSFSPLRYPGGKTSLLPFMSDVLRRNDLDQRPYAEPFAGGCGLALGLLFEGVVSEIHINDIDASIWAFWHSVLHETAAFVELIAKTDISLPEWRHQRTVYLEGNAQDPLALGFAAFFLNRTNRSGIIKGAGVIGGMAQQGNYKIDCRFNRDDLCARILRVANYRDRITLTRLDAVEFLRCADEILPKKSLLCIDPPYFNKGSSLYTSFYKREDHQFLSEVILGLQRPWLVTYDRAPEIEDLYRSGSMYQVGVNYSVETKRKASELLVTSPGLIVPETVTAVA